MKLFWNLNDSELLYLISEHNEQALNLMYNKYSVFIKKTINNLGVNSLYWEELFQEGLILLIKIIRIYEDRYEKSFFSYFELVLKRRFYKLINEYNIYERNIIKTDNFDLIVGDCLNQEIDKYYYNKMIFKSKLDQMIYEELIIGNRKVKSFCQQHNLDAKKVYNKIYYLKKTSKV